MQVAFVYVDTPYIPVQVDSSNTTLTSPLLFTNYNSYLIPYNSCSKTSRNVSVDDQNKITDEEKLKLLQSLYEEDDQGLMYTYSIHVCNVMYSLYMNELQLEMHLLLYCVVCLYVPSKSTFRQQ